MAAADAYVDQVVVVTGASSGFGRGVAVELARRGTKVVLAARSDIALAEVARECQDAGGEAIPFPTDVSMEAEVAQLAQQAIARFGQIDVWINNAGVGVIGRFDEAPYRDHEQVVRTNLLGVLASSYHALQHFRQRGAGVLINVASVVGKIPAPLYASYTASKFGVVGLSESLRQELREADEHGIRVCTVMPMAHDTEFFEHAANYTGHESAPIPPIYDPQVTVEAIVELVAEPEDEVITGRQGVVFDFLHRLMPNAVEKMMARRTEKAQLEDAPAAAPTAGAVHRPK